MFRVIDLVGVETKFEALSSIVFELFEKNIFFVTPLWSPPKSKPFTGLSPTAQLLKDQRWVNFGHITNFAQIGHFHP